jgi:dTDP-4-dehydrorhamnose reductase
MSSEISKPIIAVTGLDGYIGAGIRLNLERGYHLISLSQKDGFDLTDPASVRKSINRLHPDTRVILHLAACTDTKEQKNNGRIDENGPNYQINALGTQNLVRATKERGNLTVVEASTDFVFSGEDSGEYTESSATSPQTPYGISKEHAEKFILDNTSDGIVFRIASPYQTEPIRPDFVAGIRSQLEQMAPTKRFTDQITTPTLVGEIALGLDVILKSILDSKKLPHRIYHLVGSSSQSAFEAAQTVARVFYPDRIRLVEPGSIAEVLKQKGWDESPWPRNLTLSNRQTLDDLGISMSTFPDGLVIVRDRLSVKASRL